MKLKALSILGFGLIFSYIFIFASIGLFKRGHDYAGVMLFVCGIIAFLCGFILSWAVIHEERIRNQKSKYSVSNITYKKIKV